MHTENEKMKKYLNAFWTLSFTTLEGKHYEIPAQVPGNVIGDMFRANIIPDPYFGCNSNLLRPYEFIDWMYSTKFHAPILKKDERLQINLDGVDTIFELRINGKPVIPASLKQTSVDVNLKVGWNKIELVCQFGVGKVPALTIAYKPKDSLSDARPLTPGMMFFDKKPEEAW